MEQEEGRGPGKGKPDSAFFDKSVVFTGSLLALSRKEAGELVKRGGGFVKSSVSTTIDFLVAGEKGGKKKREAERLGVETLSEDQFMEILAEDGLYAPQSPKKKNGQKSIIDF